jgi:hypothetical protein
MTASSNSFSRSRWVIRPRSSPACRPRSHRRSRISWPSAPGRPASRSVSRSSTSRLQPPCLSKPGAFASSSRSIAGVRVPRRGTLTTASGLLRSSALQHSLADPKGGQPFLNCVLHPPVLSPSDYPKDQPHVRSTSSRRSRVGVVSTPWSQAPHQTNRRAL